MDVVHASPPLEDAFRSSAPILQQTARGPIECLGFGEGPAVLALHGAMGGWDQSALLARTVGAPGFRYLCVSRPGYLGTPLSSGRSSEEQADLLAALLDRQGIPDALMLAISGGGPPALHFALRHRARCRGLILISTCGGRVTTPIPFAFRIMKLLVRWPWFARRARLRTQRDPVAAARRSCTDPEVLARTMQDPVSWPLYKELMLSTADRMDRRLRGTENDIAITRTTDFDLEAVEVPALVVHGTHDRMVPYEQHGKVLAEGIRGAECLTIHGGEHVSLFTHREEIAARVGGFLAAHSGRV